MKSLLVLLTAVAAHAAVIPNAKRQLVGIPIRQDVETLQKVPVHSVERLPAKLAPNGIRERIRWGPFDLTAVDPEQAHNVTINSEGDDFLQAVEGLCRDCMVVYGESYLTYEDNSRADIGTGVYNHHIFVGAVGKQSIPFFACKNPVTTTSAPVPSPTSGHEHKQQMAGVAVQVFGSGHDGSATDYWDTTGNFLSGSYVGPNDVLIHYSTWVNYKEYKQQVYMTAEYEYVEGKPEGWVDSGLGVLSVQGCGRGSAGFFPPANQSTVITSPEYTVTAAGTVFNALAHLHDGGVNVRLFVNEELACTSSAIYGGGLGSTEIDGVTWQTITGYSRCDEPIHLEVGDTLAIDTLYDLKLHPLRPGAHDHEMSGEAMGMISTIFAPDAA